MAVYSCHVVKASACGTVGTAFTQQVRMPGAYNVLVAADPIPPYLSLLSPSPAFLLLLRCLLSLEARSQMVQLA